MGGGRGGGGQLACGFPGIGVVGMARRRCCGGGGNEEGEIQGMLLREERWPSSVSCEIEKKVKSLCWFRLHC